MKHLKKKRYLTILFLIIFLGIFEINLCLPLDEVTVTAASMNNNINSNTLVPDETSVNAKFQEIRNIPYNEQSMNCNNKSNLFASYLKKNGAKNISIMIIVHNSGKYSHEFVDWNGRIYDACNSNELSYQVSKESYLKQLQKIGFTGVCFESPYVGS
jgi:hypothetical protein